MEEYDVDENSQIRINASDGKSFLISEKEAKVSELLRDTPREEDEEEDAPIIPIERVDSVCLQKVVEFMKHYAEEKMKDIPVPFCGPTLEEVMDQKWYQDFVKGLSRDMLFTLLSASNYMGIKPLLDLVTLKFTFDIVGKTKEEIREILQLPEPTPEEEAQARKDHGWIFEDS